MDEKIYSVTLADGTIIDNLTMNGNNYISKEKLDKSIFDGNCHSVIISDGENEISYENMECVQVTKMEDKYWFVLRELSPAELAAAKTQSDIEYIALMCDVDL